MTTQRPQYCSPSRSAIEPRDRTVQKPDRSIHSISSRCHTRKLPKLFAEMTFEVDANEIACDRLEALHPDIQIWIVRIGSRVRRFGGRTRRSA